MSETMKKTSILLPVDLLKKAKAKAAFEEVSMSEVIRNFLKTWVRTPPRSELPTNIHWQNEPEQM